MIVLKINRQDWLIVAIKAEYDKGALSSHDFLFSAYKHFPYICLPRFHRPWKQGVSSVKKCWAWTFSEAARSCSMVTVQRAWSPFAFSVSLTFFQHPWRSYHQYEGTRVGEKMTVMFATVCPGDYWTSPRGSWLVEEDFGRASDSQDESGGKKTILSVSPCWFFCTISWTPLTRQYESM